MSAWCSEPVKSTAGDKYANLLCCARQLLDVHKTSAPEVDVVVALLQYITIALDALVSGRLLSRGG